jgi:hypothetical protein
MKVTDAKSRILIRQSEVRIRGSGPYQNATDPKHTLDLQFKDSIIQGYKDPYPYHVPDPEK